MFSKHCFSSLAIAFIASLTLIACSGCGDSKPEPAPNTGGSSSGGNSGGAEEASKGAAYDLATVKGSATIRGTVTWEGDPPRTMKVDINPECETCRADEGLGEMPHEALVLNGNGTVRYAVVSVTSSFRNAPAATAPKSLDQNGCQYTPHVVALQTMQPLKVKNSDDFTHNVKFDPDANDANNITQPATQEDSVEFEFAEVIKFSCSIHAWMNAWVHVFDHPYYAVTGADGSFEIPNLPPGKHTIQVWQEKYGTKTLEIEVADGETKEGVDFTYQK